MASCAVTSIEVKDPRFPALREAYKDKHYCDDHLVQVLQLCREYYDYPVDWYPETPAQRAVFTRFMNYYLATARMSRTKTDKTMDDVYNLYSTMYAVYTPEKLDARLSMLANDFRKVLDREVYIDRTGRTRQEVLEKLGKNGKNGYEVIMDHLFDQYNKKHLTDEDAVYTLYRRYNPNVDESVLRNKANYVAQEFKTLFANKERMKALAATRIGTIEGFVVSITDLGVNLRNVTDDDFLEVYTGNIEEGKENTGEDYSEGAKGERFSDFRIIKLMESLSPRARNLISTIPMIDTTGKFIRDDLGNKRYVDPRQAAVVLRRTLVNSEPETFEEDLRAASAVYPWINGLLEKFNEPVEGREKVDYRTTIYDNFKKSETTYVYSNLEGGKYIPHIANSKAAGLAMSREAGNNMRAGFVLNEQSSVYVGYGALKSPAEIERIKKDLNLEYLDTVIKRYTRPIRMVKGDKLWREDILDHYIDELNRFSENKDANTYGAGNADFLRLGGRKAMIAFLDAHPEIQKNFAAALQGLGFAVTEKDVRDVALQEISSEKGLYSYIGSKHDRQERNRLVWLSHAINSGYNAALAAKVRTGQYLYNYATVEFRRLNNCLALTKYNELEDRVVNEDQSLSTYNNVNLLHQVFDIVSNKKGLDFDVYKKSIEDEFLQYEGFSLGFGEQRRATGWLRYIVEQLRNIREDHFGVVDIAAFNHLKYSDLSREQKLTNSLIQFFDAYNYSPGFSAYEVPIQSDYGTAYNFVTAPRFSEEELLENLTDEVLVELERMMSIQERSSDKDRVILSVYEEQGLRFQVFPEFNDNGFLNKYISIADASEAKEFVRNQVSIQMEKIVERDLKTIEDSGVLTNPALKKIGQIIDDAEVSLYSESGKIEDLDDDSRMALRYYSLNNYFAREQITKLTTGGLEQFNGLIDYEKRNMLIHAPHSSLYTHARLNGQRVGKETQNVVYIEDDVAESVFIDDIKEMLSALKDQDIISASQYNTMVKAYTKIKTTDGVGLRTLESYRTVSIMADEWDDNHERAYERILKGNPHKSDIALFMQNRKPVYTGYEIVPAARGEHQKPIKATVLHKYAEQVLLPVALAKYCLQAQSVPMQAFDRAQERLKAEGKEIDMFLFHSGVKVGYHSGLQPFAKNKATGKRIINDAKSIENYIVDSVLGDNSIMHTVPFKYYGIAAATPVHSDDRIAWATQAEKVAWANIQKGDKIYVRGQERDAWQSRELYNQIKTANIVEEYAKVRRLFNDADELERIFQYELASKTYASNELRYALAHLKDGRFAVPLYSPNVEHQVQQLLASIIRKRLTKASVKGGNILQSTGLGMDLDVSAFDNNDALSEEDKLGIVFDGTGKNKRIKYVEVFLNIDSFDSRLRKFADETGNIGPDRLRELVDNGVIPESMLEFVGYRTPSDAEHSVIPCRIKGFYSNLGGANIIMPKEVMVMTGHDYDGDKLRCHFKNFSVVDKDGSEVTDLDKIKMVLGFENVNENFQRCELYEYDYGKSPLENSVEARNNARVELMFANLTSPQGSKRVLIPGGCDESKVIAKSLYLVRAVKDSSVRSKVAEALIEKGENAQKINSIIDRTDRLYDLLSGYSEGELTALIRIASGTETPFSITHAADSFDYIMGGAEMISFYAKYNSAMQMLQRTNLAYEPKVTSTGKPYTISILGCKFDKLFNIRNQKNELASLGLARLLNAAVDNGKDPILGYLNQTKELVDLTFLMFAAGMPEESIHLVLNQPSVVELAKRMKGRDSSSISDEINMLLEELVQENKNFDVHTFIATQEMAKLSKEKFTSMLALTHSEIVNGGDEDAILQQIYVLKTLQHINTAANQLAKFVQLTRPDSASGAIGSTLASIITKNIELNKFRNDLREKSSSNVQRITGMDSIIAPHDVHEGWDTEYLTSLFGEELPEIVALNSLLVETSLDMFKALFPQVKKDWVEVAAEVANQYSYKKIQDVILEKIFKEMILWKLLCDKRFINGNVQDEQKRIIYETPWKLSQLIGRISKAQQNPGTDKAAEALIGNAFLNKLTATSPENSPVIEDKDGIRRRYQRIMFTMNGPAIEGSRDMISSGWNEMLANPDDDIKNLAKDLFLYNLHTNGFGFGMYEFAHFAPFSVLMATPGYIDALQDVLKTNWKDERERENFINQYYLNHWGDKKFLRKYKSTDLNTMKHPDEYEGQLWLRPDQNDPNLVDALLGKEDNLGERYIVITSGENNKIQTLYRVEDGGNTGASVILVKVNKLGSRNKHGQVTLQYNPSIEYQFMESVVPANNTSWGSIDTLNPYRQANINAPVGANVPDGEEWEAYVNSISSKESARNVFMERFGLKRTADIVVKEEAEAEKQTNSNKEIDKEFTDTGNQKKVRNSWAESMFGTPNNSNPSDDSGSRKMLHIVVRGEDDKIHVEKRAWTPENISEARKQQVFVELNKRLREILREKGIAVGTLTTAEALMNISGVSDFDTAPVVAEGLLEMIRISEGYLGERALPEEFAHVALEMLGHDNPLVERLLSVLSSNDEAMEEAFDGMYQEYLREYGEENKDKLVLEAAGKLVAKELFRQQKIHTSPIRRLISRIVDAIKSMFRRFRKDEIQNAIFDANKISSKLAREMLGGQLLDKMSLDNIRMNGKMYQEANDVKADLSNKDDILNKLLKTELKRLSIFKRRYAYANKTEPNAAITATETQIKKLESAIQNYKSEEAIAIYLSDSLDFLQATEKKLMDDINAGRPVNSICKRLNTVRDTLYSFITSTRDIREAIRNKEVTDTVGLASSLSKVEHVLNTFYDVYQMYAGAYFEEMLSNIYGQEGKTITIGKQKGRVISIHEMATKADHDISLASRMFNSLADCDDYVLKAIDDLTRNAKMLARNKAARVRPRIEVAIDDLEKETGSRDQSFMFEKKRGEDGKLHKTGYYISEEESKHLSPAQKKFYDTMMDIKKDADQYLPDSLIEDRKIVMMRKYTMDRFKDAEGAKGKALEAWEGLKNRVLDTSDNIDFEHYEVAVDFEGNKVDMLPVKFLLKGKSESYDDMSDDVATSMMAYAGMSYEYGELNNIIGVLENAKYMASQRDVIQKTGVRTQRETITTDDYTFNRNFTKKQAGTHLQQALDDFYQMHIYGHIQKNEGTIGNTRISKRKVVDTVNMVTSYSQMAINIPQRIANVSTGMTQILIESVGKGEFDTGDVAWASKIYMKESGDRLAETGKTDYDNKLSLFAEKFDLHQNNGRNNQKYAKGRMSRIFNSSLLYAGLTMGEDYLALTTSLALARNRKVKDAAGKEKNLWDAYEVKYVDETNKRGAYLSLKSGYTNLDGSPITFDDEKAFSKKCAAMNFQMQGIYNLDDRSAIQQYAFGALIIMYRKWIAPAIKRRYSGVQYNKLRDTYEEGYHRTMFRLVGDILKDTKNQVTEEQGTAALLNIIDDMKAMRSSILLNWNKMNDYEKSNIKRSLTELAIVAGLWVACSLFGKIPPPEYEDDDRGRIAKWWDTTLYSQMLRLRTEIGSQAPTPMLVDEAMHILKSPFAAIGPLQNTINSLQLLVPSNYFTEIKSGRYRGHVKAYKYLRELPVISMFKKVDNFIDPTPMIQFYQNSVLM